MKRMHSCHTHQSRRLRALQHRRMSYAIACHRVHNSGAQAHTHINVVAFKVIPQVGVGSLPRGRLTHAARISKEDARVF
eukprot:scaffold295401_cov37-Tisochrysis_lutea.AAC.2